MNVRNIAFDLETVPLATDELERLLPPFDESSVKTGAMGSEKAQEKIDKLRREHFQRFYSKAALDARTAEIKMIGVRDQDGSARIIEGGEPDIIRQFFNLFDSDSLKHFFGFCVAQFDIPMLVRRGWLHRIPIPYGLTRGRYLSGLITDLAEVWTLTERGQERFPVSLDDLARYFGVGQKRANGAQFHEILRYKPDEARTYLLNDLELTWKIAEAMGAIRGPVPEPAPLADAAYIAEKRNGILVNAEQSEILFY